MTALTLPQIKTMDVVVPDLRLLGFALDCQEQKIGKLACLVSAAWSMFDTAVEEGFSAEVRNELAETACSAEIRLTEAKQDRDQIKAELLAVQQ